MSVTVKFNEDSHQYIVSKDETPIAHLPNAYIHENGNASDDQREKFIKGAEIVFAEAFSKVSIGDLEKETSQFFPTPSETSTAHSRTERALQKLGHIANGEGKYVSSRHTRALNSMAIILPDGHPAIDILKKEGIEVKSASKAGNGPRVKTGLVNLMPNMIETETQYARSFANADQDVEITIFTPEIRKQDAHKILSLRDKANITPEKLEKANHRHRYHHAMEDIPNHPELDGLAFTGFGNEDAPLAQSSDKDKGIDWYDNFRELLQYAQEQNIPTITTCWSAQAALKELHDVRREVKPTKLTGVFKLAVLNAKDSLMKGLSSIFPMPTSRYAESNESDIQKRAKEGALEILATSKETGAAVIRQSKGPIVFITGHLEYLADTLKNEYERDCKNMGDENAPKPKDYNVENPERSWATPNAVMFKNIADWFESARAERRNLNFIPKSTFIGPQIPSRAIG